MIYLTGDIHASHGFERLSDKGFPGQNGLAKSDYVIICGDFGCVGWRQARSILAGLVTGEALHDT
jgi:hypothetical protein